MAVIDFRHCTTGTGFPLIYYYFQKSKLFDILVHLHPIKAIAVLIIIKIAIEFTDPNFHIKIYRIIFTFFVKSEIALHRNVANAETSHEYIFFADFTLILTKQV